MTGFLQINSLEFQENVPLKGMSSFHIGGNADIVIYPSDVAQVSALVAFFKKNNTKFIVLGNGTNVLFPDEGLRIPVIKTEKLSNIVVSSEMLTAGAGCLNSRVASAAQEHSLTGFEFAHGIPGSIGGAVFMNAGAYGEDFSGIVAETEYVDANGNVCRVTDHKYGYRKSVFTAEDIICNTVFHLNNGVKSTIKSKTAELAARRRASQPLEYPSAGSIFKRPEGYFTGKLIQDCGLKGFTVGGAQVSEKHAGFIINRDNATSNDVKALITYIQKTVNDKFGVMLEAEIKIY